MDRAERLALLGILALVAVCFFLRLGGVPLLGKDEPRYAEVAREMFASGDWITPRLAGHAWFEKPALPYWLMGAGYAVVGVGELGARLGSAVLATLSVAAVYAVARRAAGPRRAATAAMVLSTSALWLAFARGASFDMPLAATMAFALGAVFFFECATTRQARVAWAAAAGAAAGASMLAKGLAGPLLLGMIVGGYLVSTGSWRRLRITDVSSGALAALAVAAIWYVPVSAVNGQDFVDEFFVNHHFRRFLTNKYQHPQPFYFFPLVALAGLAPWTLVFASGWRGLGTVLGRRPESDDSRLVWLAAWSVVVPVCFFSISTSKLPGYILPVFPGLAILTAWAAERLERESTGRWAVGASGLLLAALGAGLAAYGARTLHAPVWEVVVLAGPPLAAAAAVIGLAWRGAIPHAMWGLAAGGASAVALVVVFLFAELGTSQSLPHLSAQAGEARRSGESLLCFGVIEYAPVFYLRGDVVVDERGDIMIAETRDQVLEAASSSPTRSILVVSDAARVRDLTESGGAVVETLGSERNRLLVRVSVRPAGSP